MSALSDVPFHDLLDRADTLGEALREARERSGLSALQLETQTRVHRRHLAALEQNDWSALPSRIFAIGYVRAYAQALGLDEHHAVERLKRESPDSTVPLQAPTGIAFQEVRKRSPWILAVAAVLAVAVLTWNVVQRVGRIETAHPSEIGAAPDDWAVLADQATSMSLGAPLPAPPDQTTPELYVTPGLEAQLTGVDPADAEAAAQAAAAAPPVQRAFNPRGALYGAPANVSRVTLQANRTSTLVVRISDSRILFARALAAGDAWRAPLGVVATIDVSDPAAFDIYLNGEHGGVLAQTLTPLASLNARAEAAVREAEARQAARLEAQRVEQARLAAAAAAANPPAATPTP